MNAEEKFLKEINIATLQNTQIIRTGNRLLVDMEQGLLVWIDYQTSHNILLSQRLTQSKALTLFNYMEAERGEETADEKFEASRSWVTLLKR